MIKTGEQGAMDFNIEMKLMREGMAVPAQAHAGEWVDLAAVDNLSFKKGDFQLVDLGVCIKLPPNCEAILAPRSSTFKNFGLLQTNSIGVVDNSYCGDGDVWKLPVYATRDVEIEAGTRLAQFKIQPCQGKVNIALVDSMSGEDRGGFGSTGF